MSSLELILHWTANAVGTLLALLDTLGKLALVVGVLWLALRRESIR